MSVTLSNVQPLVMDAKYEIFTSKMACKNVEDNIKLIELIKNRPIIYDSNLLGYKDTIKKETAWLSIALAMKLPVEVCQTRWKSLRDSFRKRDKKSSPDLSGTSQNTWRYTEMLSFLKNTNTRRKASNEAAMSFLLGVLGHGANQVPTCNADDSDHSDQALSVHVNSEDNETYETFLDVQSEAAIAENKVLDDFDDAPLPVNRMDCDSLTVDDTVERPSDNAGDEESTHTSTPVQRLSPKSAHKVLEALATANVLKRKSPHHRPNGFPYHRLPASTASLNSQQTAQYVQAGVKRLKTEIDATQPQILAGSATVITGNNIITGDEQQTSELSPSNHQQQQNQIDDNQVCVNAISIANDNSNNEAAVAAASFRRKYDEDDLFGLSVAASLKKCSYDQRLTAKIEIMRILHASQRD